MTLAIRQATQADLTLLVQLYAEMDNHEPITQETAEILFKTIQTLPGYRIYLAFQNQEPVGTFSLLDVPTFMHPGYHKYAILDAVTIRPHLRGQGIGTQMLQQALQISTENNCYKVTLSSNLKRAKAHQFYQSLGFEQHGWSFKMPVTQRNTFG